MASRKKKADTAVKPLTTDDVTQTAASKAKDKEEGPVTVRVDLGESLPTRPFPTATDND